MVAETEMKHILAGKRSATQHESREGVGTLEEDENNNVAEQRKCEFAISASPLFSNQDGIC